RSPFQCAAGRWQQTLLLFAHPTSVPARCSRWVYGADLSVRRGNVADYRGQTILRETPWLVLSRKTSQYNEGNGASPRRHRGTEKTKDHMRFIFSEGEWDHAIWVFRQLFSVSRCLRGERIYQIVLEKTQLD